MSSTDLVVNIAEGRILCCDLSSQGGLLIGKGKKALFIARHVILEIILGATFNRGLPLGTAALLSTFHTFHGNSSGGSLPH